MMRTEASHLTAIAALLIAIAAPNACGAQTGPLGVSNWLTVAGDIPEAGYRRTQFFAPRFNTAVVQWDSRAELWLPPFRDKFSWGPYLRFAGIAGSTGSYSGIPPTICAQICTDEWQNAWLGRPGLGFEVYPLSSWRFQGQDLVGRLFGPLRAFAEYNFIDYWGNANQWRPHGRVRAGFDYWKAVNVNKPSRLWWIEIWNGIYWQSTNEFDYAYDSVILGNSVRAGIRMRETGAISTITPYLAVESSRTKYDRAGIQDCLLSPVTGMPNPCDFYWENRLLGGAGVRFAPSLARVNGTHNWLSRFVVYGEYLDTATYYGPTAPSFIPRVDVRVGLSASIGQWYR